MRILQFVGTGIVVWLLSATWLLVLAVSSLGLVPLATLHVASDVGAQLD